MKIKLAGAREHIPWQQQIDLLEVDALTDEFGWDEWLEMVGGEDGGAVSAIRVATPMPSFHRHNERPVKVARATNWDSEFAAAQSHARDVLAKLGNL
jgi:hypothetical protein